MEDLQYEERKRALIEEITAVFDGVQRGNGTTFYEGTALDNGGFPDRVAAARAKDTETRWQDVPYETFRANYSAISFLDPKGFRYYLPALMIWYLRFVGTNGPDSNSNLFDSIIPHLMLSGDDVLRDYVLARFQAVTPSESKVVAHFLQLDAEMEKREEDAWCARGVQRMVNEGKSQAEIDDHEALFDDINDAQIALDRYWGQFL